MRKSSGLRNRFRSGKSTYSKRDKGARADRYGSYLDGKMRSPERVAGKIIDKPLPSRKGSLA